MAGIVYPYPCHKSLAAFKTHRAFAVMTMRFTPPQAVWTTPFQALLLLYYTGKRRRLSTCKIKNLAAQGGCEVFDMNYVFSPLT